MILITVVDDRMGMCFNRRRLSRDRVLSDKILTLTNGKVLWMSSYSEKLFGSVKHSQINIDDDEGNSHDKITMEVYDAKK